MVFTVPLNMDLKKFGEKVAAFKDSLDVYCWYFVSRSTALKHHSGSEMLNGEIVIHRSSGDIHGD